jgi:RNA polymerase sigma factor (sigma-70 family)
MTEPTPSASWALVLAHRRNIERMTEAFYPDGLRRIGVTRDDFRQEVLMDVAKHAHEYDPTQAKFTTWAWWRIRRVRARLLGRLRRRPFHVEGEDRDMVLLHVTSNTPAPDTRAQVIEAVSRMKPREAEAILSVWSQHGHDECLEELGVSHTTRDRWAERARISARG